MDNGLCNYYKRIFFCYLFRVLSLIPFAILVTSFNSHHEETKTSLVKGGFVVNPQVPTLEILFPIHRMDFKIE